MKVSNRSVAFLFLLIILTSTAGCAPHCVAIASKYAKSMSLYSADNPSQQAMQVTSP